MERYLASDGWILYAIARASIGGPPSLRDIIAIADHANVLIPTLEEINGAVKRLCAGGLLRREGPMLEIRDSLSEFLSKNGNKSPLTAIPLFNAYLAKKVIEMQPAAEDFITAETYRLAVDEYLSKIS